MPKRGKTLAARPHGSKVLIYWDYESCPIPSQDYESGKHEKVIQSLKSAAGSYGKLSTFCAYIHEPAESLVATLKNRKVGVCRSSFPREDIIVDAALSLRASNATPQNTTFVFISTTGSFVTLITKLRALGCPVVLLPSLRGSFRAEFRKSAAESTSSQVIEAVHAPRSSSISEHSERETPSGSASEAGSPPPSLEAQATTGVQHPQPVGSKATREVAIFWDYENCPLRRKVLHAEGPEEMAAIFNRIKGIACQRAHRLLGFYAYIATKGGLRKEPLGTKLEAFSIELRCIPAISGCREVVDHEIMVDIVSALQENKDLKTIALISEDRDFSVLTESLVSRGLTVLLLAGLKKKLRLLRPPGSGEGRVRGKGGSTDSQLVGESVPPETDTGSEMELGSTTTSSASSAAVDSDSDSDSDSESSSESESSSDTESSSESGSSSDTDESSDSDSSSSDSSESDGGPDDVTSTGAAKRGLSSSSDDSDDDDSDSRPAASKRRRR